MVVATGFKFYSECASGGARGGFRNGGTWDAVDWLSFVASGRKTWSGLLVLRLGTIIVQPLRGCMCASGFAGCAGIDGHVRVDLFVWPCGVSVELFIVEVGGDVVDVVAFFI